MKDIFAVYKPQGPTSRKFLNQVQKISGIKKWGHGGTLDPMAEGILIVAHSSGTKHLFKKDLSEKQYFAKLFLGEESTTDDIEGEKTKINVKNIPSLKDIQKAVEIVEKKEYQVPPLFSAIKVNGEEAYKKMRRGESVILEKRKVDIKKIEIIYFNYPHLDIRVITGRGVYIRSIAKDIGKELSCGAYLSYLKRERVGMYTEKDCINIENGNLLPLGQALKKVL